MKNYQLTEKYPDESSPPVENRFFFQEHDASCYKLDYHIDYMIFNEITEMDLILAERETNSPHFFCQFFKEVGEKSESGCGKLCEGYKPRNGKSGVCKHYGYTYEQTDRRFTLKLSGKTTKKTKMKTPYLDAEIKFLEKGIISFYQRGKLEEYRRIKQLLKIKHN